MDDNLLKLIQTYGTPLFVIDHKKIRENYRMFIENLPEFKCYYAIKANSTQEIIETLFHQGSSFDVASYNEFMQVYNFFSHLEEEVKNDFIKDRIIFSNTIKDNETLKKIRKYKPLVTFDNHEELKKIKEHCSTAKLLLRLKVPDSGSAIEMGSKFGAEVSDVNYLISQAKNMGLQVKGISFHVGSQCTNFNNFSTALEITAEIIHESKKWGFQLNTIDIGGGFPVAYDMQVPDFKKLANIINFESKRLFSDEIQFIAEPGRFMVANTATLITEIIGKSRREGKIYYHINDGIYTSFSGVIFDHFIPGFRSFKDGDHEVCAVVGPTCDSFDKISMASMLPANLEIGDFLLTDNIGAYSIVSSTKFNGFEGPKIVNINQVE